MSGPDGADYISGDVAAWSEDCAESSVAGAGGAKDGPYASSCSSGSLVYYGDSSLTSNGEASGYVISIASGWGDEYVSSEAWS